MKKTSASSDIDFMAAAIDLARLGVGKTSPNPAVGAVIVKKGKIVATGFHKKAGMPHAEVEALTSPPTPLLTKERSGRRRGEVFEGAALYVTLEPCCHFGRTPPCTDAIIRAGIRRVVIGMRDPDRRVSGRGIRILRGHGIDVIVGVLKRECEKLNEAYCLHRRTGRPFVTLKIASTLDGKAGLRKGRPPWLTSPESRLYAHRLRDEVDAILVGVNTVIRDNPKLNTRLKGEKGHDPVRVVLDSRLRIPKTAHLLHLRSSSPTWIASTRRRKFFSEVIVCRADQKGRVDLNDLLRKLGRRGIMHLLVEGGPTVWSSFIKARHVDRLMLFLAPRFLGEQGLDILPEPLSRPFFLKHLSMRQLGCDLLIEGRP